MHVPCLSFGCAGLGTLAAETPEEDGGVAAVRQAIQLGVNYLDTAPWYGQGRSESVLGKALKGVPRDSFLLATKVGRYESDYTRMFDFSYSKTLASVSESLHRTGQDYFDVVQVHDVEFAPSVDVILTETLPALETLRQSGKVRNIGITGYPLDKLREVIEKSPVKIDIVLSYCRGTLFDDSLREYIPFFQSRDLGVANAAPLGMGLLASCQLPSWHPAAEELRDACSKAKHFCQQSGVSIEKLGVWYSLFSFLGVHTTLVGMTDIDMLERNLDCLNTSEAEQDMAHLVRKRFFEPLGLSSHWEGKELSKIKSKLSRQSQVTV